MKEKQFVKQKFNDNSNRG